MSSTEWIAFLLAVPIWFGLSYGVSPAFADDGNLRAAVSQAHQTPISGRTLGGAIDGSPKAGCTCRYKGKDVFLGESVCMKTGNGLVKAQCSRYLNNTSWKITQTPCPVS